MTSTLRLLPRHRLLHAAIAAAACLAATPSFALYKVVGPDGKITYTDRPPTTTEGRVSPMNARSTGTADSAPALPIELREAAGRYPVTLYTFSTACEPCDAARTLLRQRGIPHTERQVVTSEDGEALVKLTGGRDAPVLAIGAQLLKGLAPETWNSYLDAAGYPQASRLPPGYAFASPQPLTERREPTPASRPAPAPAAPPAEAPPAPGTIKF
ncbi:glutaredoxin family protein [Variovorax sp. YR752]|uniref:glutaredoxin family protein n=1 Tax=Variovorax sp. YR752 TaxID=1884383 RepID=UPI0031377ADD